jgi:hypothetical protein
LLDVTPCRFEGAHRRFGGTQNNKTKQLERITATKAEDKSGNEVEKG